MTVLIKGSHVRFEMTDGSIKKLPVKYGIIHDPEGVVYSRCDIYFGPYRATRQKAELTRKAAAYFGGNYDGKKASVNVPDSGWKSVGQVVQIFYRRPGKYEGNYFHPWFKHAKKKTPLTLSKSGSFYLLALPDGCIVNDRGFVYP